MQFTTGALARRGIKRPCTPTIPLNSNPVTYSNTFHLAWFGTLLSRYTSHFTGVRVSPLPWTSAFVPKEIFRFLSQWTNNWAFWQQIVTRQQLNLSSKVNALEVGDGYIECAIVQRGLAKIKLNFETQGVELDRRQRASMGPHLGVTYWEIQSLKEVT